MGKGAFRGFAGTVAVCSKVPVRVCATYRRIWVIVRVGECERAARPAADRRTAFRGAKRGSGISGCASRRAVTRSLRIGEAADLRPRERSCECRGSVMQPAELVIVPWWT